MNSSAVLSPNRRYRFVLRRVWATPTYPTYPTYINFIMLNPSTADAIRDDATIRRCIAFAKAWRFDGLVVTNLFALRATNPKELQKHADPVGLTNDRHILDEAQDARRVVCAWGGGASWSSRGNDVRKSLEYVGVELYHLGLTKRGAPRHPLYLAKSTELEKWIR